MSKRTIYRPKKQDEVHRRREWVSLDGGEICVWELTMAESVQIMERAARPPIDRRGGMDPGESMIWQILLSCYDGEEDGAAPIFQDADILAIYRLRMEEFTRLTAAIQRVNGMSGAETENLRGFFEATPAGAVSP